jgi:hypothetical protein
VQILLFFSFVAHLLASSFFSQIAYMDFIDFNGNAGPIDYRLPRIRYIKNEDFLHLQSLDLRLEKRKYGLLPVSSFQLFLFSTVALSAITHAMFYVILSIR